MVEGPGYSSPLFPFSSTKNKLTVVGCNAFGALAILFSQDTKSLALGCLASCVNSFDPLLANNSCSGFGCCQTPILPELFRLGLVMTHIRNDTLPWISDVSSTDDVDGSRSCGYVFLVEAASYTFKTSHLSWHGNKTFPVVLDWNIATNETFVFRGGSATCQAARSRSDYACKSSNSVCEYRSGTRSRPDSYVCRCESGYQGNPYLPDPLGCQDIDECVMYNCNGICVNIPGSYRCNPKLNSKLNAVPGINFVQSIHFLRLLVAFNEMSGNNSLFATNEHTVRMQRLIES